MATNTYDPKRYTLVVAGIPIPTKGYADGEFIKVVRAAQKFTKYVSTDGQVTRIRMHDDSATCTFTTAQRAEVNSILTALYISDVNSANGAGIGPFLLKDQNGLTVHEGKECWIAQMPEVTLDKGLTVRPWIIDIANMSSFEGG